jgi:hypothetical protein
VVLRAADGGLVWVCGAAGAVVCGGGLLLLPLLLLLLLLLGGLFVDLDGFLAVLGRAVDVAGFLGEDLEEAEVDGLFREEVG